MYRILTSSNRAVAQCVVRSTLSFTRAESSTDPEAGSIASGHDSFSKKEKAEETRWVHRFEAERAQKNRTEHNKNAQGGGQPTKNARASGQQQSGAQDSSQQRLANLEAEKRKIDQEIAELKRNQR